MAANKILTGFVVLAALLAITVWQFHARETEDDRPSDVSVKLPKIKKDDVDQLSIAAPDKPVIVLKKTDKLWNLVEPLKSAADQSAVDAALAKLDELEVTGVAATKADNYEALEVTDKKATHVIAKQGDKVLADLLIGTYRGGNTMVREPKATNVATVKSSIRYAFDKDIKDWRDRLVVEATPDQVKAIAFDDSSGSFHFVREDKAWKQAPGEKPLPNFDGAKVNSLVGTATNLHAVDFATSDVTADAAGVGAKPIGVVTLTTAGDAGEQQIVLHVGQKHGDGYYLAREGKDSIFIVSDFAGGRLTPSPEKFAKDKEQPKSAAAAPSGPGAPGGAVDLGALLKQHPELAGKIQPH
ncbi:MAG TPA: DUF4340 domain-containing protein [Polyangiales bacterium]|jgi:hypothetical protein